MEASRHAGSASSASSHYSSSSAAKHLSSAAHQQGAPPGSDADRQSALPFEPFVTKYAWAAMGIVIAISGSLMLLACSSSSSSSKQAKRSAARGSSRSEALACSSQAHHYSQRAITPMKIIKASHSQGTNTEAEVVVMEDAMAALAESKEAKKAIKASSNVIKDADVCSPLPELIIRDMSESTSAASGQLHPPSLIDTETLDRSAPLTIFSSLSCPVPETIRRPISWSEPYIHREDFENLSSSYDSHPNLASEPLKPTSSTTLVHISSSTTTTKRKNIPILGPSSKTTNKSIPILGPTSKISDKSIPIVLNPSSSSPSYPCTIASSSKGPHQYSFKLPPLSWTQVRMDLFLLLSILSFIFFYLYLKRDTHHKPIEIQPVKPFPVLRLFP